MDIAFCPISRKGFANCRDDGGFCQGNKTANVTDLLFLYPAHLGSHFIRTDLVFLVGYVQDDVPTWGDYLCACFLRSGQLQAGVSPVHLFGGDDLHLFGRNVQALTLGFPLPARARKDAGNLEVVELGGKNVIRKT
jgi:hypothetical protein